MTLPEDRLNALAGDKPRRLVSPEWCPGTYDLHLYCKYDNADHGWDEFPWQISQFQTYGESASWARSQGWILHRDRTATCPKCARALALKSGGEG